MKLLIDIGHPAHVHYFRNSIKILMAKGHEIILTAREKENSLVLLDHYKLKYTCTGKNLKGMIGKFVSIIRNDFKIFKVALKHRPDLFVSFSLPFSAHVGFIMRKPVIGFTDTEHAAINQLITNPFTDTIFTPLCFKKDFGKKHIRFNGYMELCYLHPNYFTPDPSVLDMMGVKKGEKYVILRFVSWNAEHDMGHSGLNHKTKLQLLKELSRYTKVFISSEGELSEDLKQYHIKISPEKMHDVLYFATLYIGEGATMASECAMLGTPAIYVNSLTAGTLEEQQEYGLIYGFKNSKGVLERALELLQIPNLKKEHQNLRKKLLSEKIDVTKFIVWMIENYPESIYRLKTPAY